MRAKPPARPPAPRGLWRAALLLSVFLLPSLSFAAEVEVLPPREYFPAVLREIEGARSSIAVSMFVFSLQSNAGSVKALRLAEALVRAQGRGVKVEVVLDRNMYAGDEGTVEGKNLAAYSYLKQAGVPVYFDDPATLTHAKAVVIDEKVLITGSSNWSQAAFDRNNESNVLIRSTEAARDMLRLLGSIEREEMARPGPAVALSASFLTDHARFGRIVTDASRDALDLYLFLLWQGVVQGTSPVKLDYGDLARHMGKRYRSDRMFRNNVRMLMDRMRDRYGLLEYKTHYGKPADVRLLPLAGTETVKIPAAYWEYGWNRRLTSPGKGVYLISLRESAVSPLSPRWSHGRLWLAAAYGVSPDHVSSGVTDLRRANLIEVAYGELKQRMDAPREPSLYTPNPLYDPADLEKGLAALQKQHGPQAVARAQKAAAAVYEDSDLPGIAHLISLEREFGPAKVNQALKKIKAKSPSNPRRTLPYLLSLIQIPEED